jgi:hypothetical protein
MICLCKSIKEKFTNLSIWTWFKHKGCLIKTMIVLWKVSLPELKVIIDEKNKTKTRPTITEV